MNEKEMDSFDFIVMEKDPKIIEEMDHDPFDLDDDEKLTVIVYPTWFGFDMTRGIL